MKNPLFKRIPKEIIADWRKYLVIAVFMVVMIGVVSGMYVGHDSMLSAVKEGRNRLHIEDGSFELSKLADQELLTAIASGEKADLRQYFIDQGIEKADQKVAEQLEKELTRNVKKTLKEEVTEQCHTYGITDQQLIQQQVEKAIQEHLEEALKQAKTSKQLKKTEAEVYEKAHKEVLKEVDKQWDKIEKQYHLEEADFAPVAVKIYEHFYREEKEDNNQDGKKDANLRLYQSDSWIDQASFNKGRAPKSTNEIAIDRMHADNVGVGIGDHILVGGKEFEIVGLLSYVNYTTLHESNTDFMFDAFGFDVGMVTPDAFAKMHSRVHYSYAFKYQQQPVTKIEKATASDNFMKALITQSLVGENEVKDYLPEYLRQASNFATSDIEGDTAGTGIMCYILIGVIAFIFAITISNTIDKEAAIIGTLRASGYSKGEMIVHYMAMPVIVTMIGALLGNIFGYTVFRDVAVDLYYNSYSLPTCYSVWSKIALVKTTVIPLLLMFFINLFVITKKLQFSPLRFLRHDFVKAKNNKARPLPKWSFMRRFRLRVLFQNMPNYVLLVFGVIFVELMLCFAFGLPDSLTHYGENAKNMVFADYQYMLMGSQDEEGHTIKTKEKTAEPFCSKKLMYPKNATVLEPGMGSGGDEGVTVYGIVDDSQYMKLPNDDKTEGVYLSSAYRDKFGIKIGDTIRLHEEYENKSYHFTVTGFVSYDGGIAVFMHKKYFHKIFETEQESFTGYFSRKEIKDIDEKYIATVLTVEDIEKITVQLIHSMGGAIDVFKYALIILSAALIYLLAKIIIERNEHAISLVKILGFKNREIAALYIVPTAMVVVVFSIISFGIGYSLMVWIFKVFILQMDGYFAFYMKPFSMVLSVVYLLIGYVFVSVLDFMRIKKIPMDVALKNMD